jgi:archaellum component FlaC
MGKKTVRLTESELVKVIHNVVNEKTINEQIQWLKDLKALIFGAGKEAKVGTMLAKDAALLARDLRPYLKDILAAKQTIKMTPKVNKAFAEVVNDLSKAESQIHSLNTSIIGPNRGQILGQLSDIESRLQKAKLDFAKSDGSVINLKQHLDGLNDEYNWLREYFRTPNAFKRTSQDANTVRFLMKNVESELLRSIQTIEDRVIRAAANMLKANP